MTETRINVTAAKDGRGAIYVTRDGDVIDQVCWRYYGRTRGTVEKVLKANPHALGTPVLSAGVELTLPEIPAPTVPEAPRVRLFD
jgi:phage tail protein X